MQKSIGSYNGYDDNDEIHEVFSEEWLLERVTDCVPEIWRSMFSSGIKKRNFKNWTEIQIGTEKSQRQ